MSVRHKPARSVKVGDDIYINKTDHGPVKRIEHHDSLYGRPGDWIIFIVDIPREFANSPVNVHPIPASAPVDLYVEEDVA